VRALTASLSSDITIGLHRMTLGAQLRSGMKVEDLLIA
jgi:hypothetical protein